MYMEVWITSSGILIQVPYQIKMNFHTEPQWTSWQKCVIFCFQPYLYIAVHVPYRAVANYCTLFIITDSKVRII